MCRACLKEAFVERQRTCHEAGTYLANFAGCHGCKDATRLIIIKSSPIIIENDDEEEYEEATRFDHVCACGHVVASHEYSFVARDGTQEYMMNCGLCGKGADVLVHDRVVGLAPVASAASRTAPAPVAVNMFAAMSTVVAATKGPDDDAESDWS